MERQPFAFFAQIEPIKQSSNLFEILKKKGFYFYYFQYSKAYYLFLYGKNDSSNFFNTLLSSLVIIQELNTKQRKIRSIRGFLLYALEIIQDEKQITVVETNFQPLFWRRLPNVIQQNKKNYLLKFLFGFPNSVDFSFDQKSSDQEFKKILNGIEKLQSDMSKIKEQQIEILAEMSKIKEQQIKIRFPV